MIVRLVATNALKQIVRRRLFFNVAVFGAGMLVLSMLVGQITFGYPDRVIRSIGLSGIAIAVDLMALLVAVGLVQEEIERKTLFVLLARPVRRWQYVIGRYLGLLIAIGAVLIGFAVVYFIALQTAGGAPRTSDFAALLVIFPEAAVLGAFGVLLSTFTTPTLATGIGLGFWICASTIDDFVNLAQKDEMLSALARGAAFIFPNFSRFDLRGVAVYQGEVSAMGVAQVFAYGGIYLAALLVLASLVLGRRDMV